MLRSWLSRHVTRTWGASGNKGGSPINVPEAMQGTWRASGATLEANPNNIFICICANLLDTQDMIISAFDFWKRIDAYMIDNKITLRKLAAKTGISYSTINSQRTRQNLPKVDQLVTMAQALGLSLEYMLTGKGTLPFKPEAQAVQNDERLQALVRAALRDDTLLGALSALVKSYENEKIV